MIPTHQSNKTNNSEIVVNQLSALNDYDFSRPHRHSYFEFFCFIEGGGMHEIDFHQLSIESFSIQIVAPGQVHNVKRSLNSFGFVYLFTLDALKTETVLQDFLFDHICYNLDDRIPEYRVPKDMHQWFKTITDTIWSDYNQDARFKELNVRAGIQQLCAKCLEWDDQTGAKMSGEYAEFRRMLFKEFRNMKKVKDYANALNMSEKSLNDLVKTNTGKSASHVIYDQIVMEAKRLLQMGMTAKATAYDLNFDDPGHFSKFFKSQTGLSPTAFRTSSQ